MSPRRARIEAVEDDQGPKHDPAADWLKVEVERGLRILDVEDSLQYVAAHVTTQGAWEKGVVSPSLVGRECRLQRLKVFLGHEPAPGRPAHRASAAAVPNAISLINMDRGFVGEGLLVAALKAAIPDRIVATAPLYAPSYNDPSTHMRFAGHPDVLLVGETGDLELVQIKVPSSNKFARISQYGDAEALQTYKAQMATELFISRHDQTSDPGRGLEGNLVPIVRNNLLVFSWDHTGTDKVPKIHAVPLDWGPDLDTIPLINADEIAEDTARALAMGEWPEPYPEHAYGVWPCAYCPFSRLGDYFVEPFIPKCDDHEAWK